jgi:hypothetical protein
MKKCYKITTMMISIVVLAISSQLSIGQVVYPTQTPATRVSSSGTNTVTAPKLTGVAVGDFLLMSFAYEKGSDVSLNVSTTGIQAKGWTLIRATNQSTNVGIATFYRFATAADIGGSDYSFTVSDGPKWSIAIIRLTGVSTTSPIQIDNGNSSSSQSTSVVAPAIVTTTANAFVAAFFTNKKASTYTQSFGTERFDVPNTGQGIPSNMMATYVQSTAGTTGTKTATATDSESWAAMQVAFNAAPPPVVAPTNLSYSVTNEFSYTYGTAITAITPTNGGGSPTSYSISPSLPTGLNFSTITGQISGTPEVTTAETSYTVTATNSAGNTNVIIKITVGKRPITITPDPNQSKVYGSNDPASFTYGLTTGSLAFSDVFDGALSRDPGDAVDQYDITLGTLKIIQGNIPIKAIDDLSVSAVVVDVTLYYNITLASEVFSITAKELTVSGTLSSQNKVYDGNDSATLTGLSLVGIVGIDDVSLVLTGSFDNKNVGDDKPVSLNSATISGNHVSNYSLAIVVDPGNLKANITKKDLSVNGVVANNKPYDGNTDATIDITGAVFVGLVTNDVVSLATPVGTFDDPNVDSGIPVTASLSITGTDAGNYNFIQPTGLSANITPKQLTVVGALVNSKVYDGATSAVINLTNASLSGIVSGDESDVSLTNAVGTFNDANVGVGKAVMSLLQLTGSKSGNYSLLQPTLTGDITPLTIYIGGSFTSNDKPFDGNTNATFASNSLVLVGVLSGDLGDVTLTNLAIDFDDAYFDGLQPVRITNADLSGSKAANYVLSLVDAPTTMARIIMFRVSGYKFNDLNGNGTWDSGEPGLEGWTIHISGSSGSHARVTDANGFYAFDHILPGNYQVREVEQSGWVQSAPGGEGFVNVTLSEPRALANVNFGNWKYSTIAGSVYKDLSGEGLRDASSEDFEGVTVVLRNMSNVIVDTQVTDASGEYLFEDVAPGHYYITVTAPEGHSQSYPSSGNGYHSLVTSGSTLDGYEFGLFKPVVLTGFVYLTQVSKSADGQVQDDLIPAGITVSGVRTGPAPLKLTNGMSSFSFELPEDGFFYVDNLLPGLYQVQIFLPEYYFSVTENPIIVQLNANIEIEIAFGIQYDEEAAPEVATSSISGTVFFDADGSGTWTESEPGTGSQMVTLTGRSQRGDEVTRTVTSASDGTYIFSELPAGQYMVSVAPSGGMSAAWPMSGSLTVKLDKDEDYGGSRLAVIPMAVAAAGDDFTHAGMTLAIDTNLDGVADTRIDVSGTMVASLGGFAGQASRAASLVWFSGMGTDAQGRKASVSAPGLHASTGSVSTLAGVSSASLITSLTVVFDGQVLYASAPVGLGGVVTGWPFRGVALTSAGQGAVDLRDPFGNLRARIVLAEIMPLHGVDLGVERADFGDAPNTYGTKRATRASTFVVQGGKLVYPGDGARHLMPQTGNPAMMLGATVTADANGKVSDLADADSDDGVVMAGTVSRGSTLDLVVTVTGVGRLSAWADWNRDGSFGAGEQILTDVVVDGTLGVYNLSVAVPAGASEGLTFVRFRITSQTGVGPTGMALDGEVEDYALTVGALASGGDGSSGGGTGTNDDTEGDKPSEFRLGQNYPNPFNPTTVIPFELAQTGSVKLAVFDVTGRQVAVLVNTSMGAGRHTVTFNAAGIPSGVYIVRLEAGGQIMTSKLTLLK